VQLLNLYSIFLKKKLKVVGSEVYEKIVQLKWKLPMVKCGKQMLRKMDTTADDRPRDPKQTDRLLERAWRATMDIKG